MKIKDQHIDALGCLVVETLTNVGAKLGVKMSVSGDAYVSAVTEAYELFQAHYSKHKIGNDTHKRALFDLMQRNGRADARHGLTKAIYAYANDTHIYTALKHVGANIAKYAAIYEKDGATILASYQA